MIIQRFKQSFYVFMAAAILGACKKEEKNQSVPTVEDKEYKHIRVLVSDAASSILTLVTPTTGTSIQLEAPHPNATLHATGTRRFGALLYSAENRVHFFDTGLELHDDHVDIKGTPKLAAISGRGTKPGHFKSRQNESLIFNEGDGTLSIAEENTFHVSGATMRVINAGLLPHHGAMTQFGNGTIAVTLTDKHSTLSGPHGVKIIDKNGQEIHPASIAVNKLHGNATDGKNAVFGVAGGVLVVKENGDQRIIPNPTGFGETRLGTILEAPAVNKFIGYTASKGAYFIDIEKDEIRPIVEGNHFIQCKTDYEGKHLVLLSQDGTLQLYDLNTGKIKKESKLIAATNSTDTHKPAAEATTNYIYILLPALGELQQVRISDFTVTAKIKVTDQPSKLTILGYQTNESH